MSSDSDPDPDPDPVRDEPFGGIVRHCASCQVRLTEDNCVELQMGARGYPPIAPECHDCYYGEQDQDQDDQDQDDDDQDDQGAQQRQRQRQATIDEALLDEHQRSLRE